MSCSRTYTLGAAVGGAGTATKSEETPWAIVGSLLAVGIVYKDSPPAATTDVTVSTVAEGGMPSQSVVSLTDAATDTVIYPTHSLTNAAGAAQTYDGTRAIKAPLVVAGRFTIAIAQANEGDYVVVTFVYEGEG